MLRKLVQLHGMGEKDSSLNEEADATSPTNGAAVAQQLELSRALDEVQQLAVEIENPFGYDANDIPMDQLVKALRPLTCTYSPVSSVVCCSGAR